MITSRPGGAPFQSYSASSVMDASQHPTFEHDDGVGDDYDAPQAKKHGPTGRPPAGRLDERLKQEAGKSAKVEIDFKNLFHRSPPPLKATITQIIGWCKAASLVVKWSLPCHARPSTRLIVVRILSVSRSMPAWRRLMSCSSPGRRPARTEKK
jgi:hypothetical protein